MAEVIKKESVDSKKFLKNQVGKKMKYNDRMKVEIIKETTQYKKGDIINPHSLWAKELIGLKIAKKYTAKTEE